MPIDVAAAAKEVVPLLFGALSREVQTWINAEAKRDDWTYGHRSLEMAWLAFRGTYERERLAAIGEDWPPERCVRVRAVPASDNMRTDRDSVSVEGNSARVAFRLLVANVAPFMITLRQHQVACSVCLPNDSQADDLCNWKGPEVVPGYQDIHPGKEHALPFEQPLATRTFPSMVARNKASHLTVYGYVALLGPWTAHEQRFEFTSSIWLPTLLIES